MKKTTKVLVQQIYDSKESEWVTLFQSFSQNKRASVLLRLSENVRQKILKNLPENETIEILNSLDPDDATDLLQLLEKKKQKYILDKMSQEIKSQLSLLLQFGPETAGGLMTLDYIQVEEGQTFAEVAEKFKVHEKRTGRLPAILVMQEGKLTGYLPGHELGFSQPTDLIAEFVEPIRTIRPNATSDDVAELFRLHPHSKLAVLNDNSQVLGVIYSDDVLKLLKEQENSSLYDFAGIRDEESVHDSAKAKVKFRYNWLIINLATAFLASFTVGLFGKTINNNVLLAIYMPIVAGMGGNAATQTLAVMVRGIALGEITLKNYSAALAAEVKAGFVNGLINGVIVFCVVIAVNRNPLIGTILAVAMVTNLMVAAFFGTIVPLVMKRLNKDPASSATIFITTATDVLGFFVFLGLAKLILG